MVRPLNFIFVMAMVILGLSVDAGAKDLTMAQEQRAAKVFGQLKCPVCKNQSLAASTSYMAEEMKAQIREQVAQGWSNSEIKQFYVQRYGDWILTEPPSSGRGLLVWLFPGVAFLIGTGIAIRFLMLRADPDAPTPQDHKATDIDPDVRERIEQLVERGAGERG